MIKFNSLFWKVSATFLGALTIFAGITIYIFVNSAGDYCTEVNQKMNKDLASSTAQMVKPFLENGAVNKVAVEDMVHSMMVINPSIECYLLDTEGKILSYVAPKKVVKLEEVSLVPIQHFLENQTEEIIYGDDPRNPGETKTFSAAEVIENGKLKGYIYIVLASQEYVSASDMLLGSYILKLSTRSVVLALIVTILFGVFAFWFITKKINFLTDGINQFRKGKLDTRIEVDSKDELDAVASTFNQMADTIQENIEKLKGLDELRKELIGNVSHDLRTPIATIRGFAETLAMKIDTYNKEEQEKYLNIIVKSCEKLQSLVSDLFELSKLETNQIELEKEPFSISELILDNIGKYKLMVNEKNIHFNTVIADDLPLVNADISKIDRVVQNLIDNAIKFTDPNGTITLGLKVNENKQVEVSISDTGIGIKKEEIPHIFDRYYKGKSKGSTGLGLAIVKKIVELHQTTISVDSALNKGSSFSFLLPAHQNM